MKKYFKILALSIALGLPTINSEASAIYEDPPLPLAGSEIGGGDYVRDAFEAANKGVEVVFSYVPQNVYKVYTQEGFITDIRLEPNEVIKYIGGGDTLRWMIDNADSGRSSLSSSHIFVKPLEQGISTNLIINTDRRVYQLLLVSGHMYNPVVSWIFPKTEAERQYQRIVKNYAEIDPLSMNFRYKISDKSYKWAPDSVFRTENKTYFKMKSDIANSELPTFFEIDDEGKLVMVSFRYLNGYFVVDKLIDKGVFILGKKQVKVSFKG